jgi:hypothetical protein
MKPVYCIYDHGDENEHLATALAPQMNGDDIYSLAYVPVCPLHIDGWYDGADFTEKDYPIVPLTDK